MNVLIHIAYIIKLQQIIVIKIQGHIQCYKKVDNHSKNYHYLALDFVNLSIITKHIFRI